LQGTYLTTPYSESLYHFARVPSLYSLSVGRART